MRRPEQAGNRPMPVSAVGSFRHLWYSHSQDFD
jgi:hypothetical protein